MDPDTSPPDAKPPLINYIISFLLVGVAWGFTTPFIRRAAADFNARQEAKQPTTRPLHELIRNEHEQSGDETELAPREGSGSDSDEESEAEAEPEVESESESEGGDRPENVQTNTAPKPAWMNPQQGGGGWLRTKVVTLFWTIINLLRTPAYLVPLVINLTGSVWFFLLVGKHGAFFRITEEETDQIRTLAYRAPGELECLSFHRPRRVVCRAEGHCQRDLVRDDSCSWGDWHLRHG